ncbi:carboxylesterase/lipase family protein, partial [Vibrio sp. 10N.222.55.C6]
VGITSHQQTQDILSLTDFYPNSESSLGGALDNMKQFKTLLNDTLFNGPARHMAANSGVEATLYHFEHKPSFNMWNYKTGLNEETGEYDQLSIIDLF